MGPRLPFAAIAAGRMNAKEMQRVATDGFATQVEHIASGAHPLHGSHTERVVADGAERGRRIENGHINTPPVTAVGHQVFVAG